MVVLVDFVVFVAAGLVVVAIVRRNRHVVRLRTRPYRRRPSGNATGMLCVAHEASSSSPIWQRNRHVMRLRTRPYRCCPSGNATGMSCACARGLIVVAIVRRNRHVVRLRTRPYCRCPSGNATGMSCACARGLIVVARLATQPACRALAHEALLSSPVWRRNQHVVRLRTRPYRRCPSGDATGMSCACTRGLIVVAIVQRDRHVVRLRTRPYRRRHRATLPTCCAQVHEALSSSPVW
jgi:hypothetical protein